MQDERGEETIIGGLTRRILDELAMRDALAISSGLAHFRFRPADLVFVLDSLLVEFGVHVRLHTWFSAPVMEDGRISGVIVEDVSGRRMIRTRFVIDTTSDALVVQRAGFACREPAQVQPPTTCAVIEGLQQFARDYPQYPLERILFDPQYPEALPPGFIWGAALPGSSDLRMVAGTRVHGANCAHAEELTAAELEGRRQLRSMMDLLRHHFPGSRPPIPVITASHIGIRQTRHIHGLQRVHEQDLLSGHRFPDAIGCGTY
ncbi:MAG: FAD-dependent oxidoreductase, partial [Lentisphaerae bacterium]